LELERSGGITNKKKSQKNKDRYAMVSFWFCIVLVCVSLLCQFGCPLCELSFPLLNQCL
jgi:ABC-type antimicrobial peptide transport system permease subunit